jgi:hypothetical protein
MDSHIAAFGLADAAERIHGDRGWLERYIAWWSPR